MTFFVAGSEDGWTRVFNKAEAQRLSKSNQHGTSEPQALGPRSGNNRRSAIAIAAFASGFVVC